MQLRDEDSKLLAGYLTDRLRQIEENTARYAGGAYQQRRWLDLVNPTPQDDRTGDEIAADVIARAGLEVVHGSV